LLGKAEIDNERLARFVQEDVAWFQVAVENAALVGSIDGAGHLGHQGGRGSRVAA
jgi:hypothetical protein